MLHFGCWKFFSLGFHSRKSSNWADFGVQKFFVSLKSVFFCKSVINFFEACIALFRKSFIWHGSFWCHCSSMGFFSKDHVFLSFSFKFKSFFFRKFSNEESSFCTRKKGDYSWLSFAIWLWPQKLEVFDKFFSRRNLKVELVNLLNILGKFLHPGEVAFENDQNVWILSQEGSNFSENYVSWSG